MTMITAWFRELVEQHPDADALVEPDGDWVTFGELDQRAAAVAGGLRELGLEQGDRLASFVPNSVSGVELFLAAARIGAITVGVNTRYRAGDLRHVLERAHPRLLVSVTDFLGIDFPGVVAGALDELDAPAPRVVWPDELERASAGARPVTDDHARPHDLAVAFTTSGTTGEPKLAAHCHVGAVGHIRAAAATYGAGPGDTALLAVPFCGTFGFVSLFVALAGGARVVVPGRFDPVVAAALVEAYGVTHVNGSDDMLLAMLDAGHDLRSWRHGVEAEFTGRGAMAIARAEEVGARITGVYGSSETFALLARWSPDDPFESRARNGGIPADPATGVRVVDADTGAVLDHGVEGELQLRGPSVLDAYLAGDGTAAPELADSGWFATGDLATTQPGGGFEYLARLGDTLRLAGFLTDPAEIEQHLAKHPAVSVAQVVGVTGAAGGEVAVAFVVLAQPGAETVVDELTEHCRSGLANYKVPARIVVVEEFPTVDGANGVKIRKTELRDRAARLLVP